MKFLHSILIATCICFTLINCTKSDDIIEEDIFKIDLPKAAGDLVSVNLISTLTAANLKASATLYSAYGININQNTINYDVDIYKVVYKTMYKNNLIDASGLVALPKNNTKSIATYSFQHGTIILKSDAPSVDINSQYLNLELAIPASFGMVAVLPDYIGFGSSSNLFHTYYIKDLIASSVLDNIKAAKILATKKSLNINKKLILIGYSEGGYATMATHQYIEKNNLTDFEIVASYPAAGGYDIRSFQDTLKTITEYEQPFYLGYVVLSYKNYYNYTSPTLSDIFTPTYSSKIEALYDGSKDGTAINDNISTKKIPELLQSNFLNNIYTNSTFLNLKNAIDSNSLINWKPTAKMYMYHGKADNWVFYQNSVKTFDNLIKNGATNVIFTPLEGTHTTAFVPYANDVLTKINALGIY